MTRWNVDDDLALRVILLLVDQQKNPMVCVPLVKTRVRRRNEEPELTTYPCFPRLGHTNAKDINHRTCQMNTNAKDINYRKMRQLITFSQPQKVCVSFSSHLSALFIRYSCCFTVVAQEDLQKKVRKDEGTNIHENSTWLSRFSVFSNLTHRGSHLINVASKGLIGYLQFHWKFTDQISPRMHLGSGEGSSAETWIILFKLHAVYKMYSCW